jgi:hypothetical protein
MRDEAAARRELNPDPLDANEILLVGWARSPYLGTDAGEYPCRGVDAGDGHARRSFGR